MIPNPGSDAAIARGCICPMLDNEHGTDVLLNDEHLFWINADCPVHAKPPASANPPDLHIDISDTLHHVSDPHS